MGLLRTVTIADVFGSPNDWITPVTRGMGLRLRGSTSGYVGLKAPAAGAAIDFTLPSADGTSGQAIITNGSGGLSFGSFASTGHNHDGVYSLVGHNHDASYASIGHNHDLSYAAIGHNHAGVYQPLDGELTAIAGLTSAANKLPYFTGAGTAALADLSAFGRTLIDDADAATALATIGAAASGHNHDGTYSLVGHDHSGVYQPIDSELTALAGLTSAADKLPYFTGSGTASLADLSAFGRSLIDDADSATALATIGAAASGHNHDASYAAIGHNHDSSYAAIGHNHTGVYQPLAAPLTALSALANSAGALTNDGAGGLSWVPATVTAPGGSSGQLQYNNAGAFGGAPGLLWQSGASPNLQVTAQNLAHVPFEIKLAASASARAFNVSSSAGTGDLMNVRANGDVYIANDTYSFNSFQLGHGAVNQAGISKYGGANSMLLIGGGVFGPMLTSNGFQMPSGHVFRFTNGTGFGGTVDTGIGRNATGVTEFNSGTLGQLRDIKFRSMYAVAGSATDVPVTITLAATPTANALTVFASDGTTTLAAITKDGYVYAGTGRELYIGANGSTTALRLLTNGDTYFAGAIFNNTGAPRWKLRFASSGGSTLENGSDGIVCWRDTQGTFSGSIDLGAGRNASGVMEINNGTAGQYRDLILRNLTVSGSSLNVNGVTYSWPAASASGVLTNDGAGNLAWGAGGGGGGVTDHGALTGLGDDDHTQYALLAGRAGGQTLVGGTASGENLTLSSTAHATKGKILFGAGTTAYDQVNNRLGIGTNSPTAQLTVVGDGATNIEEWKSSGGATQGYVSSVGDLVFKTTDGVFAAIEYARNATTSAIRIKDSGNTIIQLHGSTAQPTYFNTAVGINKSSSIGAQLHVVAASATTVGQIIQMAASPTAYPLEIRGNDDTRRVSILANDTTSTLEARHTFAGYKISSSNTGGAAELQILSTGGVNSSFLYQAWAIGGPSGYAALWCGDANSGQQQKMWAGLTSTFLATGAGAKFELNLGACRFTIGGGATAYGATYATATSPTAAVVAGTSGSGTNIAGGSLTLEGGIGTGTGVGGSVLIQVAPAGSAGASLNTLSTVATVAATSPNYLIECLAASHVGLRIKAAASASANAFEVTSNSGTNLLYFNPAGSGDFRIYNPSDTTRYLQISHSGSISTIYGSSRLTLSAGGDGVWAGSVRIDGLSITTGTAFSAVMAAGTASARNQNGGLSQNDFYITTPGGYNDTNRVNANPTQFKTGHGASSSARNAGNGGDFIFDLGCGGVGTGYSNGINGRVIIRKTSDGGSPAGNTSYVLQVQGTSLFEKTVSHSSTTSTPTGTTQTIDWTAGNKQVLVLSSASGDVTLTLTAPSADASLRLKIVQGATARDITFPATVKWDDVYGERVWNLDANKTVFLFLEWDGTNYYASASEAYS